jgi:hypothetical protein
VQPVGQVRGGVDDGAESLRPGIPFLVRRGLRPAVEHLEVRPVVVGDRLLDRGVGDDHPVVVLAVGPRRGLDADLDALLDDLGLDRAVEVEALAHGTGGGQHLVGAQVQVHGGAA